MPAVQHQDWGVWVNEVGIFANRLGMDWWVRALTPWVVNERALLLFMCPQGGVWWLPCGDRDDADFAAGHITEHGVHAKCVKVMRRPAADKWRARHVPWSPPDAVVVPAVPVVASTHGDIQLEMF